MNRDAPACVEALAAIRPATAQLDQFAEEKFTMNSGYRYHVMFLPLVAVAACVAQGDTASPDAERLGQGALASVCACEAVAGQYTSATLPAPTTPGHLASISPSTSTSKGGVLMADGARWLRVGGDIANVKEYGAKGDGVTSDTSAINMAIQALSATNPASAATFKGTVYFPAGKYFVDSPITVDQDGIALVGEPGAQIVAGPFASSDKMAIYVRKPASAEIDRVWIKGLSFSVKEGYNVAGGSQAIVQLNNCKDCLVADVSMLWEGSSSKPTGCDGIAFAEGSSGVVRNALVDGIPKVGIYVTALSGPVTVESSEVRNCNGPIGRTGISISGTWTTVRDCYSHGNGTGLAILDGSNEGISPTNIKIVGGQYYKNDDDGIQISGATAGTPTQVEIMGTSVTENSTGIHLTKGQNILVSGAIAANNRAAGISLQSSSSSVKHVHIADTLVYENEEAATSAQGGIVLISPEDVTISGGAVYDDRPSAKQTLGIVASGACSRVRVAGVNVTTNGHATNSYVFGSCTTLTGYFDIQHPDSPIVAATADVSAPDGSAYVDTTHGGHYWRQGGAWVLK